MVKRSLEESDVLGTSITTAVDYVREQDDLEKEARELMPYDPNECTYNKGELRQPVFACLTCYRNNDNTCIGVCYSCSIQCHTSHELVELFSKRNFVCDCGTTRMSKTVDGGCKLRNRVPQDTTFRPRAGSISSSSSFPGPRSLLFPADDIPGTNSYNHNFKGRFCSCERLYNPLEETGNMLQCFLGFSCGEDWYHEECILGYKPGVLSNNRSSGKNILDELSEPGEDATNDTSINSESGKTIKVPYFPELDDFDVFICWKCASLFKEVLNKIEEQTDIVFATLPHFQNVSSTEEWNLLYASYQKNKKVKMEHNSPLPISYFFKHSFEDKLNKLQETSTDTKVKEFLLNHPYLYKLDPIYEPPEEEDSSTASGSILDLGTEALRTLPREKAVEGLQAYDKIKSKLRDFFKPFAEHNKVVTEEEVRAFFGNMKKE